MLTDLVSWGDAELHRGPALRRSVALGAVLLFVIVLAALSQQPPPARGADAPPQEFSAARAMDVLAEVAAFPHAIGQANHGKVRDFLIEELQSYGLDVEVQSGSTRGRHATHNLLARVEGTAGQSADTILVAAHYDSVVDAPGAADDGVGTVAVVETARALLAGPPIVNDVVFLITDGEEPGLWGADVFVAEHPWADEVGLVLNFESGGPRGPLNVLEIDRADTHMVRTLAAVAPRPLASSLIAEMVAAAREASVGSSDFAVFRTLEEPGYDFANSKDTGFRHTPGDTVDRIDPATVQHHGETMLGLVRAYGNRDLDDLTGTGDVVWISLVAGVTLAWSHLVAWLLLGVVVALAGVLAWRLARDHGLRMGPVARAFGATLGAALAAIVTATLLIGLIQLLRPDHRPHMNGLQPRLEFPGAGPPMGELYHFGVMGIAVAVALVVLHRTRRKVSLGEQLLGTNLVFVLLAALSTWGLTGASYLFTLPMLFVLPANLLWFARHDARIDRWSAVGLVAVGAIPTAMVGANLGVYFETFTIANAAIVAPIVVLFAAQLVPAIDVIAAGGRRLPFIGTGGLGAVLLLAGLLTVSAAPITEVHGWTGPSGRPEAGRNVVSAPAAPNWSVEKVSFADGGHCLEVVIEPDPFYWCPLPADVAVPVDVQLIRRGEEVLLFGNVANDEADHLDIVSEAGTFTVDLLAVEGMPGKVFVIAIDATISTIDRFDAVDGNGVLLATRGALELPARDSETRGP